MKNKRLLLKRNVIYILLFLIYSLLFFSFDFIIRSIIYNINSFYSVDSLFPILLDFFYVLLVIGIIIFLPKKTKYIFVNIVNLLLLIVFLTNYFLLRIKGLAFSIYDIMSVDEGSQYLNYLYSEIKLHIIIIVFLTLGLFAFINFLIFKLNKNNNKKKKDIRILIIYAFVLILIRLISFRNLDIQTEKYGNSISSPVFYYYNYVNTNKGIAVSGFPEYYIREILLFIKMKLSNNNDSEKEISSLLNSKTIHNDNSKTGLFNNKNVIMIMMESIDNVVTNEETMPTLMKMKESSIVIDKRYSQGISTFATEFTTMTGLYKYDYLSDKLYNNTYNEAVPNMFKRNGYYTNSIHANYGSFYDRDYYHKLFGFDNSFFLNDNLDKLDKLDPFDDRNLVLSDEVYSNIIKTNDKDKFMSFIITISAHGPYDDNYFCKENGEANKNENKCFSYLSRRTDNFLKILLERLENDKLLDDTVIIMYADHYSYSYKGKKSQGLYDMVDDNYVIQNLPLVIYSKDFEKEEYKDIIFDDFDFSPTIFNLFGIQYNSSIYIGEDAFDKKRKNIAIFYEYEWYDGKTYSGNNDVEKTSGEFIDKSQYVTNVMKLNELLIENDYYKKIR